MPRKGEKFIKLHFKLSESKNKYIIIGDKEPRYMFLPIVLDVMELERMLSKIVEHFVDMRVKITPEDMEKGILKIELKHKE